MVEVGCVAEIPTMPEGGELQEDKESQGTDESHGNPEPSGWPEVCLGAAEPRGRGEGSSSWHRFDTRLELPALPTRNSTRGDGTS